MTNRIIISLAVAMSSLSLCGQVTQTQDAKAGQILESASLKLKGFKSIQADFEFIINDRKENQGTTAKGNIIMKNSRYRLESPGSTIFYDGKTMWTYSSDVNEVVITEPEESEDNLLLNPLAFLSSYNTDFKYMYVGEASFSGKKYHEIDLFPKDLGESYSRIKVFVNLSTNIPETIHTVGKDGVDYTINLSNIRTNQEIADAVFIFNSSAYKRAEIIDMRGLK